MRNLDVVVDDDIHGRIAAVAGLPSFDLIVRDVGLSPTTAFAQLLPMDGTLHQLRRCLDGPAAGKPSGQMVRAVSGERDTEFGRWTVEEVELVRTDRYLSEAATIVLARIPLVR